MSSLIHPVQCVITASFSGQIKHAPSRASWNDLLIGAYNWFVWTAMCVLVFSQLYCATGSYTTYQVSLTYGQSPLVGVYSIPGLNDEPYSDRSIVCMRQGHNYNPMKVNDALKVTSSYAIDTNGTSINGYRVVKRSEIGIGSEEFEQYTNLCDVITELVPRIAAACIYLGYDVLTDGLRIVDDLNSSVAYHLPDALPVLVLPYWDNSVFSRYVMNGADGSACMFRLRGRVYDPSNDGAWLMATNRSIREQKTIEWLGRPGGTWRNGWYEDQSGMRWYSDIFFERSTPPFPIDNYVFDLDSPVDKPLEIDTLEFKMSEHGNFTWDTTVVTEIDREIKSVAVSNGSRFGLFYYSTELIQTTTSKYDIETFVSNASVLTLLLHWVFVMGVLQKSYLQRKNPWENAGVGCLAYTRTFLMLPIILFPRLKTTLMAFFSLGCAFEGNQKVFADSWFVMYPAIAEFVMFYFSLLNLISIVLQRRISDALFGPTLLFFSFMHYERLNLAQSGWLESVDGRITALITAEDFEKLNLFDFVSSGIALKINGGVKSLFNVKLVVLAVNLLPVVLFSSKTTSPKGNQVESVVLFEHPLERFLSVRLFSGGGLGRISKPKRRYGALAPPPSIHSSQTQSASCTDSTVGYEILRLGYVKLAGQWLIPITDWHLFAVLSLFEWARKHFNFRILLIDVRDRIGPKSSHLILTTLDDQRLDDARGRQISISPF